MMEHLDAGNEKGQIAVRRHSLHYEVNIEGRAFCAGAGSTRDAIMSGNVPLRAEPEHPLSSPVNKVFNDELCAAPEGNQSRAI